MLTGATAGDEYSYETFKELFYPIVKKVHNFDLTSQFNKTDFDHSKINLTRETEAKLAKYVLSTRVRSARSVKGLPLQPNATKGDKELLENIVKTAISKFTGDLKGTYYSYVTISEGEKAKWRKRGMLFQEPTLGLQIDSGTKNDWPYYRGFFVNHKEDMLMWVNEEDHVRIIAMEEGSNLKSVFKKYVTLHKTLEGALKQQNRNYMYTERLGYLSTCPSNIGTGMRGKLYAKPS